MFPASPTCWGATCCRCTRSKRLTRVLLDGHSRSAKLCGIGGDGKVPHGVFSLFYHHETPSSPKHNHVSRGDAPSHPAPCWSWDHGAPVITSMSSVPCLQLPLGSVSLPSEQEVATSNEIKPFPERARQGPGGCGAGGAMRRRKRREGARRARSTWLAKGEGDPGDSLTGVLTVWSSDFIYFFFAASEQAPRRDLM